MDPAALHLKVMLPHAVIVDCTAVTRIVVETSDGAYGFLPRRLDCTAALVPGLLCYETTAEGERFVALDDGVLVKSGSLVRIAARQAVLGTDLDRLRDAIEHEFRAVRAQEAGMRAVLTRLEAGFARRFLELRHA